MGLPTPHVHRIVNPEHVLAVWNTFDELKGRKHPTISAERFITNLSKQLKKSESSIYELFDDMVTDGLLRSVTTSESVGATSSTITVQQPGIGGGQRNQRISYCLPDFSQSPPQHLPENSPLYHNHDWYCFQCHKAGEVINCTECFRVYHIDCIKEYQDKNNDGNNTTTNNTNATLSNNSWMSTNNWNTIHHHHHSTISPGVDEDFVCHVCQSRPKCEFSRKQIRKLLDFATFSTRKQETWKSKFSRYGFNGDICRCEYITYRYVDTDLLHNKIFDGRYMSLEEFLIDIQVLIHDVCLLFGPFSSEADDARFMGRTIEKEIQEAKLCTDCYINSKAKPADWISKPCKPPHDLIWCLYTPSTTSTTTTSSTNPLVNSSHLHQHSNDSSLSSTLSSSTGEKYYFPAKILLEKDFGYEVRFFGGLHDRRLVPRRATMSFNNNNSMILSTNDVPIKRGAAFDRAWNEVTKLLENVNDGYYTHSSGESDLPPSDDDYSDEMYIQPRRVKFLQRHYNGSNSGSGMAGVGSVSHILSNKMITINRHNEEGSVTSGGGASAIAGGGGTITGSTSRFMAHVSSPRSSISSNLTSRTAAAANKSKNESTAKMLHRLNSGASSSKDYHHRPTPSSATAAKRKTTSTQPRRSAGGLMNGSSALSSSSDSDDSIHSDSPPLTKKKSVPNRSRASATKGGAVTARNSKNRVNNSRSNKMPSFNNNNATSSSDDEDDDGETAAAAIRRSRLNSSSDSLSSGGLSSSDDIPLNRRSSTTAAASVAAGTSNWRNNNQTSKITVKTEKSNSAMNKTTPPPTTTTTRTRPSTTTAIDKKDRKTVTKSSNVSGKNTSTNKLNSTTLSSSSSNRHHQKLLPSSSTSSSSSLSDVDSQEGLTTTKTTTTNVLNKSRSLPVRKGSGGGGNNNNSRGPDLSSLSDDSDDSDDDHFTIKSTRPNTVRTTARLTSTAAAAAASGSRDNNKQIKIEAKLNIGSIKKSMPAPMQSQKRTLNNKKTTANNTTTTANNNRSISAAKRQKRHSGTSSPSKSSLSSPSHQLRIRVGHTNHKNADDVVDDDDDDDDDDAALSPYTDISESESTDRCSLGDTNGYHPLLYVQHRSASSISPLSPMHAAKLIPKSDAECQTLPLPIEPPRIEYRDIPCKCAEKFDLQLKEALTTEQAKTQRLLEEQRVEMEQEKTALVNKAVADARQENIDTLENLRRQLEQESVESINSAKRRQWCRNCLREAIYHCCWNTAYCSINCQQEHWQKEHKRACRRKR